jgi:hypothetical protein
MARPCSAAVLVGGAAVVLLVADAHLYRHEQRLVTDVLRGRTATVGLLVLTAHVLDVLGPFDPFRAVARLIPRSGL